MINTYLQKVSDLITQRVRECIVPSSGNDPLIYKAALYSLTSSGKRLRPALVFASCEMFNIDSNTALDPALSIELIHTYSLIHDDLPCMDDDDFRRNKPSLHKVFGEDIAILTGDYLLTYAFELITNASSISDQVKIKLIRTLSKSAGAEGMIGGQVMDLLHEGKQIDEKTLNTMHHKKTASLFIAALQFGAILANATPKEFSSLTELGSVLGLAYQIQDDVLDVVSTPDILGKPTGSDLTNKKATSVKHHGLEKAKKTIKELQKKSLLILNKFDKSTDSLRLLCTKLLQRKVLL